MIDSSTAPRRPLSALEELDRLRELRADLRRGCARLRKEAGTVMSLDFIEAAIKESAK